MPPNLASLIKNIQEFSNARDWKQFHTPKNLSISLVCEAAEVVEIFRWIDRQGDAIDTITRVRLREEIGDVLICLIQLSECLNMDLIECGTEKLKKLSNKYPVSLAKGRSEKYSDL